MNSENLLDNLRKRCAERKRVNSAKSRVLVQMRRVAPLSQADIELVDEFIRSALTASARYDDIKTRALARMCI